MICGGCFITCNAWNIDICLPRKKDVDMLQRLPIYWLYKGIIQYLSRIELEEISWAHMSCFGQISVTFSTSPLTHCVGNELMCNNTILASLWKKYQILEEFLHNGYVCCKFNVDVNHLMLSLSKTTAICAPYKKCPHFFNLCLLNIFL